MKKADLTPPLGWMGGPCKVVERIEHEVRSPRLREDLAGKVEHGQKLTNPEAAKVYSIETDKGGGVFRAIKITPHAQYRMDQRAITVGDLRVALQDFSKKLNDWKSQQSWEWDEFERNSMRGEPIEWNDKRLGDLRVVFRNERGTAIIISTYWVGQPDPRPEACGLHPRHAGIQREQDFGVQTWVKDPSPNRSDTDKPEGEDGKYPTRALPDPPWATPKNSPNPIFNVPGESGSDSSGTVHKDKKRSQSKPGGQYEDGATHPLPDITDSQITPKRRPGVQATEDELFDGRLAYTPDFSSPHPPSRKREHEQKSIPARYDKKRYKRMKGRYRPKAKMRARRLRTNGRWKNKREWAREAPKRHERGPASGARTIADRSKRQREEAKKANFTIDIPFFHYPSEEWGTVIEVSPFGMVHIEWDDGDRDAFDIDTFFDEVVIEEEPLEDLFAYMDEVFEDEGEDEDDEFNEDDPLFDAWLSSQMANKVALGGIQLRTRPRKRRRRQRGQDKLKAKQRYRRNRMKSKVQSRKRYKRLKKNPTFQKQQKIRRKHPERFKMLKTGEVLTAPEIAFVLPRSENDLPLGYVRNISGMTGLVHFWLADPGHRMLQSLPVREFLALAVFLSEEDEDAMYELIDAEVGVEAYDDPDELDDDLVNLYTIGPEFPHPMDKRWRVEDDDDGLLIDPEDGDFYYGVVNKLASEVIGTFFREVRPPEMAPDTKYDRANDQAQRERLDRKPGTPGLNGPYEDEVHDSNPGSRVLPTGKGHFQREARFNYRTLPTVCQQALVQLIRTPMWKVFAQSGMLRGRREVLKFLQMHGWDTLTDRGLEELLHQIAGAKVGHWKAATLIREIREGCGPDLVARSEGLAVKLARVDAKNAVWLFNVEGSAKPYRVRLKAMRKGNVRDIQKVHIKVSCSCPFWQWQGPEFHAKQGDYLYGKPRGLATRPDVKDPNNQHRACKHVLAVLAHVGDKPVMVRLMPKLARYLADTLRLSEMITASPEFDLRSRRVAARYLASMEVRDA